MICFDFKKKKECDNLTVIDELKKVKYVISPYLKLDADISDCNIIEWGRESNFHVAFPPTALSVVTFEDVEYLPELDKWRGRINVGCNSQRNFSIQNQILYIAKCY